MNKYVRVFLKGEPVRWFDFTITGQATFHAFVMQARWEGFVIGSHGYIVHDEIKAMMLCETTEKPTVGLGFMQTAGQA